MILNVLGNVSHDKPLRVFKPNLRRFDNICLGHLASSIIWDRNNRAISNVRVRE